MVNTIPFAEEIVDNMFLKKNWQLNVNFELVLTFTISIPLLQFIKIRTFYFENVVVRIFFFSWREHITFLNSCQMLATSHMQIENIWKCKNEKVCKQNWYKTLDGTWLIMFSSVHNTAQNIYQQSHSTPVPENDSITMLLTIIIYATFDYFIFVCVHHLCHELSGSFIMSMWLCWMKWISCDTITLPQRWGRSILEQTLDQHNSWH